VDLEAAGHVVLVRSGGSKLGGAELVGGQKDDEQSEVREDGQNQVCPPPKLLPLVLQHPAPITIPASTTNQEIKSQMLN
jgi:hypothetical protein